MDFRQNNAISQTRDRLATLSSTFCPVKWRHATIHLASGHVKSCCHSPLRPIENIIGAEFHDTNIDRQERKDLLAGNKPSSCQTCWDIEDQGHISDRLAWSSMPWIYNHPYKKETLTDSALKPTWIELNFSSKCNLKCAYCSPNNSTSWAAELKKYGPIPTVPVHNDLSVVSNSEYLNERPKPEMAERFWAWFESTVPDFGLIKLTGGEPFLCEETFELFDRLLAGGKHEKLELAINTNMMTEPKIWDRFIEYSHKLLDSQTIGALYLHPSLDAWGARAEFIRFGLNLETFEKNALKFLKEGQGHFLITATATCLSLCGTLELYEKLVDWMQQTSKSRWISIVQNPVHSPAWLSLRLLPDFFKSESQKIEAFVSRHLTSDIYGFHDLDLDRLKAVTRMIGQDYEGKSGDRDNLLRFMNHHDKIRGTDFKKTFPELEFLKDYANGRS